MLIKQLTLKIMILSTVVFLPLEPVVGQAKTEVEKKEDDLFNKLIGNEKKVPPATEKPKTEPAPDKTEEKKTEENSEPAKAPNVTETGDPVREVIEKMRQVQQRLENAKLKREQTGKETQELQQNIIQDLDKLIELARQSPPPQQPPPQNDQQSQNQNQQPQSQASKNSEQQDDQNAQSQNNPSQSEGPRQPDTEKKESTEDVNPGQVTEAELRRRQERIIEIWGHLPERLRARVLNINQERTLPQYEEAVRRYYEALANEERAREAE